MAQAVEGISALSDALVEELFLLMPDPVVHELMRLRGHPRVGEELLDPAVLRQTMARAMDDPGFWRMLYAQRCDALNTPYSVVVQQQLGNPRDVTTGLALKQIASNAEEEARYREALLKSARDRAQRMTAAQQRNLRAAAAVAAAQQAADDDDEKTQEAPSEMLFASDAEAERDAPASPRSWYADAPASPRSQPSAHSEHVQVPPTENSQTSVISYCRNCGQNNATHYAQCVPRSPYYPPTASDAGSPRAASRASPSPAAQRALSPLFADLSQLPVYAVGESSFVLPDPAVPLDTDASVVTREFQAPGMPLYRQLFAEDAEIEVSETGNWEARTSIRASNTLRALFHPDVLEAVRAAAGDTLDDALGAVVARMELTRKTTSTDPFQLVIESTQFGITTQYQLRAIPVLVWSDAANEAQAFGNAQATTSGASFWNLLLGGRGKTFYSAPLGFFTLFNPEIPVAIPGLSDTKWTSAHIWQKDSRLVFKLGTQERTAFVRIGLVVPP